MPGVLYFNNGNFYVNITMYFYVGKGIFSVLQEFYRENNFEKIQLF